MADLVGYHYVPTPTPVYTSSDNGDSDRVLGDYIQGRLNQWAHWARAQGPRIFFLFEGPPTGCGEIIFLNKLSYCCY